MLSLALFDTVSQEFTRFASQLRVASQIRLTSQVPTFCSAFSSFFFFCFGLIAVTVISTSINDVCSKYYKHGINYILLVSHAIPRCPLLIAFWTQLFHFCQSRQDHWKIPEISFVLRPKKRKKEMKWGTNSLQQIWVDMKIKHGLHILTPRE